jgi:hypothetical protein
LRGQQVNRVDAEKVTRGRGVLALHGEAKPVSASSQLVRAKL